MKSVDQTKVALVAMPNNRGIQVNWPEMQENAGLPYRVRAAAEANPVKDLFLDDDAQPGVIIGFTMPKETNLFLEIAPRIGPVPEEPATVVRFYLTKDGDPIVGTLEPKAEEAPAVDKPAEAPAPGNGGTDVVPPRDEKEELLPPREEKDEVLPAADTTIPALPAHEVPSAPAIPPKADISETSLNQFNSMFQTAIATGLDPLKNLLEKLGNQGSENTASLKALAEGSQATARAIEESTRAMTGQGEKIAADISGEIKGVMGEVANEIRLSHQQREQTPPPTPPTPVPSPTPAPEPAKGRDWSWAIITLIAMAFILGCGWWVKSCKSTPATASGGTNSLAGCTNPAPAACVSNATAAIQAFKGAVESNAPSCTVSNPMASQPSLKEVSDEHRALMTSLCKTMEGVGDGIKCMGTAIENSSRINAEGFQSVTRELVESRRQTKEQSDANTKLILDRLDRVQQQPVQQLIQQPQQVIQQPSCSTPCSHSGTSVEVRVRVNGRNCEVNGKPVASTAGPTDTWSQRQVTQVEAPVYPQQQVVQQQVVQQQPVYVQPYSVLGPVVAPTHAPNYSVQLNVGGRFLVPQQQYVRGGCFIPRPPPHCGPGR